MLPILLKQYPYTVTITRDHNSNLPAFAPPTSLRISSASIETETKLRWFILKPANYHDAFFNASSPANRQIPTQVTGAIAETITLRLFQLLFGAQNIEKISERPSSLTADFAMDIQWSGATIHCLVETKGSNRPSGVLGSNLSWARRQLRTTLMDHDPTPDVMFASLVSFRRNRVDLVELT